MAQRSAIKRHCPCIPGRMLSQRAFASVSEACTWDTLFEASAYFDRLSELLEGAQESIVFVGWQVDSRVLMPRPEGGFETFQTKILRLVERSPALHAYFLMWDHAYFYVLERERMQGRVWDEIHPRVHFVFDNRHPLGASHHEKIVLIDGKIALCGGIDVCGDRWDSPEHSYHDPRRSLDRSREHHGPYHDIAVEVSGPVCTEIHRHVQHRWKQVTVLHFPTLRLLSPSAATRLPAAPPRTHRVYLSRTQVDLELPLIREIEFLLRDLILSAEHRILIEGQYYWSRRINELLILQMRRKQRRKGRAPLQIHLILADMSRIGSLTRLMSFHELNLLAQLEEEARRTGTHLEIHTPVALDPDGPDAPPRPVYIHSKVCIIDDRYVSIGSANIAARALRVDTELNLTWEARTAAERAKVEALAHEVVDHWRIRGLGLRRLLASDELSRLRRRHRWLSRFPWQTLFDPELPWFFPLRRAFRVLSRLHPLLATTILSLVWLGGALGALGLAGTEGTHLRSSAWAAAYCVLASSSWLIPAPFLFSAVACTVSLGPETASRIHVSALWVAAILGYSWTRTFPLASQRFLRLLGVRLPRSLGRRSFRNVLKVVFSPGLSLQAKIAGQGFHSIYLPWFAFSLLVLLPAALHVGIRILGHLLASIGLRPGALDNLPELLLAAVWVLKLARIKR